MRYFIISVLSFLAGFMFGRIYEFGVWSAKLMEQMKGG